jgi:hypothetical protein
MTVQICDRCGLFTVDSELCICATPHDPMAARRRHQAAVKAAKDATQRQLPVRRAASYEQSANPRRAG